MSNVNATREEIVAAAHSFAESMNDQNAIEHYGVKGMKWGKWNDETKRKYGLVSKTKAKFAGGTDAAKSLLSKAVGRINAKVESKKAEFVSNRIEQRKRQAELAAQRKELGMPKKKFDKLRDETLKSHDPKVIARGMHTLTDEELKAKITRLYEEDKISKMALEREKARHQVNAARNAALNANPVVQIGKGAAQQFVNKTVNELGYNTIVKKGIQPPLEQRVEYAAKQAQQNFSREHPVERHKIKSVRNTLSSGKKTVSPTYGMKPLSSVSKSSSSEGRRWTTQLTQSSPAKTQKSTKAGREIERFNRENEHYTRVLNEGAARNELKASRAKSKAAFERAQVSSTKAAERGAAASANMQKRAQEWLRQHPVSRA